MQGYRNQYAITWKCECGSKTAVRYTEVSKKFKQGHIEECFMAVRFSHTGHTWSVGGSGSMGEGFQVQRPEAARRRRV